MSSVPPTPLASQAARDALARGRAQVAARRSLSVAVQNIRPATIHSSQLHARRQALRASTPQPIQRPPPLAAPPSLRPTPHPDDPLQTQHQLGMLNAFRSLGRLGLSKFIYEEARGRALEHSSWRLLAEDEEEEKYVYRLLHLLPDNIITSLIRNTLSYDARTIPAVKSFVNAEMMPKEISTTAGIYINIARRVNIAPPPQVDPHAGKWLTPRQVKSMLDMVETYLANKPDHQSVTINTNIDNAVSRFSPQSSNDRRFPVSPQYRARVQEWIKVIESQYWTHIQPNHLDLPFSRCPFEVGWAQDINTRLKAHVNNASTTPLFGLVNAISRLPVKDGGAAFPKPMQLILFPISKDDDALKKIAEILGSVLCSSYWIYGGLNYAFAGGSVNVTTTNAYADNWIQGANRTHKRLKWEDGLDFARVVQMGENAEEVRKRAARKTESDACESEWRKKREKCREQRAKVRSLKKRRDDMDRRHRDDVRRKIEEGNNWMKGPDKIYGAILRRRTVMETITTLHQLRKATARGDAEVILELKEVVAGVDPEVLKVAQARVDETWEKVRAQRRSGASATEPQQSKNIIDLTSSQDTQLSSIVVNLPFR